MYTPPNTMDSDKLVENFNDDNCTLITPRIVLTTRAIYSHIKTMQNEDTIKVVQHRE